MRCTIYLLGDGRLAGFAAESALSAWQRDASGLQENNLLETALNEVHPAVLTHVDPVTHCFEWNDTWLRHGQGRDDTSLHRGWSGWFAR